MKPNEREQLRLSLLRFLDAQAEVSTHPLAETVLLQMAKAEGLPRLELADVKAELTYLQDKGLVGIVPKAISPELKQWRITAGGRDHYAQFTA